MNFFIDYLNSTNNAGSDTTGALAEAQVKSEYYGSIKVDRKLGSYISNNVRGGNHKAYILTGHAGDGKTSILVQVLLELGYLGNNEGLEKIKEYPDFYYVKDMSEVGKGKEAETLKQALDAPLRGKTSLLISNTGPLLMAFKELAKSQTKYEYTELDEINLQTQLLDQLDKNKSEFITVAGYEFLLVNIARVDNVPFAKKLLKNLLQDSLWKSCEVCQRKDKCPMYFNKVEIAAHFDRVAAFVENYYRFLFEIDKRMTIRQMFGQISYAITGNLTCIDIKTKLYKNPKFDFNFANLFFGYQGLKEITSASQIKGVQQIRNLELDNIALNDDYILFVTHDYSKLPPEFRDIIGILQKKYRKNYQISEQDGRTSNSQQIEIQLRKAVRRFYLMYSMFETVSDIDSIMNQIYGGMFTNYRLMITQKQSGHRLSNEIQKVMFQALYIKNTGFSPDKQVNELPLTLRREDDVFQNVMLTIGSVKKSDLVVLQCKESNQFEDIDEKFAVELKIDDNHSFPINLPLLTYFNSLIDGAIASNSNPALTHGIAQLNALLYEKFAEHNTDCELSVLVNTIDGQKKYVYGFDNGKIYLG